MSQTIAKGYWVVFQIVLEVIIDILPIIVLFVALRFRKGLRAVQSLHLVPIDVVHPFLWLVIHYNSKQILHYSLLPFIGVVFAVLGVVYIFMHYFKGDADLQTHQMFRKLFNQLFIFSLGFAIVLIIWRVVQLIIGG